MTDILIVEDNAEICGLLSDLLRNEGFAVSTAESGEKALEIFEKYGAKLVVLDIMLPGMDGFAVCRTIREKDNTPIISLSARDTREDKLSGLELGADDYMDKPCDFDILTAKIRGIFRRRYDSECLTVGELTLNRARQTAFMNGAELQLTAKEFELLRLLAENAGVVLNKSVLFSRVWGSDSESEEQTLTVHIKRLREKIEDDPKKPKHIVTAWGVGYRYEA